MSFPHLEQFLEQHAHSFRVAFSGGANEPEVNGILRAILERFIRKSFVVITGGTMDGVPGVATEVAYEYGIPIIGVLPARGDTQDRRARVFSASYDDARACKVVVPPPFGESSWGDAAPVFVGLADAVVAIGGSWGTTIELAHALKVNTGRVSKGQPPIRILPHESLQGVAARLRQMPWMDGPLDRASFPSGDPLDTSGIVYWLERLASEPVFRP